MRTVAIAFGCLLVIGCDDNFHDDYNRIDGLRMLGVVAEPPEAGPGETVQVRAVATHLGSGPIALRWAVCTLAPIPGTGTVNASCLDADAAWLKWADFTGDTAAIPVPAVEPASLGPADATGGRYL